MHGKKLPPLTDYYQMEWHSSISWERSSMANNLHNYDLPWHKHNTYIDHCSYRNNNLAFWNHTQSIQQVRCIEVATENTYSSHRDQLSPTISHILLLHTPVMFNTPCTSLYPEAIIISWTKLITMAKHNKLQLCIYTYYCCNYKLWRKINCIKHFFTIITT